MLPSLHTRFQRLWQTARWHALVATPLPPADPGAEALCPWNALRSFGLRPLSQDATRLSQKAGSSRMPVGVVPGTLGGGSLKRLPWPGSTVGLIASPIRDMIPKQAIHLPRSGSTPKPRVAQRTLGIQRPKFPAPCKGATSNERLPISSTKRRIAPFQGRASKVQKCSVFRGSFDLRRILMRERAATNAENGRRTLFSHLGSPALSGCRRLGVPCPRVRCATLGFGVERLRR
jgi:hypothetical protein